MALPTVTKVALAPLLWDEVSDEAALEPQAAAASPITTRAPPTSHRRLGVDRRGNPSDDAAGLRVLDVMSGPLCVRGGSVYGGAVSAGV